LVDAQQIVSVIKTKSTISSVCSKSLPRPTAQSKTLDNELAPKSRTLYPGRSSTCLRPLVDSTFATTAELPGRDYHPHSRHQIQEHLRLKPGTSRGFDESGKQLAIREKSVLTWPSEMSTEEASSRSGDLLSGKRIPMIFDTGASLFTLSSDSRRQDRPYSRVKQPDVQCTTPAADHLGNDDDDSHGARRSRSPSIMSIALSCPQ